MAFCDPWDHGQIHAWADIDGQETPFHLEMKRLAPGGTNTWFTEILDTDGGVHFSTAEPKTLRLFEHRKEQWWKRTDPGFPDVIKQMWAVFLTARAGELGGRCGCATPEEAVASYMILAAALGSQFDQRVVP